MNLRRTSFLLLLMLSATGFSCASTRGGASQPPVAGPAKPLPRQVLSVLWRIGLVDRDVFSSKFQHRGTPELGSDGQVLVVGTSQGEILAMRSADGAKLWRHSIEGPADCRPLVHQGIVYLALTSGAIKALSLRDGKLLWETSLNGPAATTPVLFRDKLLVLTSTDELVCLRARDGKWLWNYRRTFRSDRFKVLGAARPLVKNGFVWAGFSDGTLVKLVLEDGAVAEVKNLAKPGQGFSDVDVDPVAIGNLLVTGVANRGVLALDAETLAEAWEFPIEAPSSLAVQDDRLYFTGGDGRVLCLDARSGKSVWEVKPDQEGLLSLPVIAGPWLLVSSEDVSLLVIDRATGTIMQVFNPGKGSSAAPVVSTGGHRAFWVSNGETIYGLAVAR